MRDVTSRRAGAAKRLVVVVVVGGGALARRSSVAARCVASRIGWSGRVRRWLGARVSTRLRVEKAADAFPAFCRGGRVVVRNMGGRAGLGRAVRVEGRAGRGGSAAEAEDQLGSLRRGQRRRRRGHGGRARAL